MFEQAVDLDPGFATAIAGLAHMHFMNVILSTGVESKKSLEISFELANRAIALDDSLAYAYSVIGMNYLMSGQHDRAIAGSERAVRLNPNSGDIVARLGVVETWCGKLESAIRNFRKAMRLTPHFPPWYVRQLGLAQLFLEKYEEAINSMRESIARAPDLVLAHVYLAAAYAAANRDQEAQSEVQEILRLEPDFNLQRSERLVSQARDKAQGDLFLNLLRKAGLPE